MSEKLTDQFIDETFPGLLHASGRELPETGLQRIYDGNGNRSALSIGRDGEGGKVSGDLLVDGVLKNNIITYPTTTPSKLDLMVADPSIPTNLKFLNLSQILELLGVDIQDGSYPNPTLEFENGILTGISTTPPEVTPIGKGIFSYDDPTTSNIFTVPAGVTALKFIVTGGGASGGITTGNAGATAIGYLTVNGGESFLLKAGSGGGSVKNSPGKSSIITYNGLPIITANGGEIGTTNGSEVTINNQFGNISSYMQIKGGVGAISTDSWIFEESPGAASYWGSSPAYGGGSGSAANTIKGSGGANGVIVFEW